MCTFSGSRQNREAQSNNKCGLKGVCYYKRDSSWSVRIRNLLFVLQLYNFNSKWKAAYAYNIAVSIMQPIYGVPNIIPDEHMPDEFSRKIIEEKVTSKIQYMLARDSSTK